MIFIEASAKTNFNVDEIFKKLAQEYVKKEIENQEEKFEKDEENQQN